MNRHCTNLCSFLSNLASSDRTFKALSHIATPFFFLSLAFALQTEETRFFLKAPPSSSSRLQACTFLPPLPSLGALGGKGSQCLHSEREREKRKKKRRRPSLFPKPPGGGENFSPPFHLIYLFCVINVPGRSRLRREKKAHN